MDRSRGAALVDLNLDGKLDLVVVNRNAPVEIYQNATPPNRQLAAARHPPTRRQSADRWRLDRDY